MKPNIDNMLKSHRDDLLSEVLTFFNRLLTVVAVFAGIAAMIRFREKLLPSAPDLVALVGIILIIIAYGLLVWVSLSGWYKLTEIRGYSWRNHIIGILIMIISIVFITAGTYAAIYN